MMSKMGIEERFKQFEKFVKTELPARKAPAMANTASRLGGEVVNSDNGDYILRTSHYLPGDCHGEFSFAELENHNQLNFDNFTSSPSAGNFNLNDVVVVDTETTGLSGGVGTVPFLVGLGYFDNDCFIVRQHFLPDYCEELGFLEHLFDDLPGKVIVSFNGRAFDLPLLTNRFLIQRTGSEFFARDHLDIIFTLRRFFRLKLPDCTLKTAESSLLGFERLNDVPSEQIPQIYFDYLRDGNPDSIYQVVIHNQWDILSTLGVLVELNKFVEKAERADKLSEQDSWALGKFYLKRRDFSRAMTNFSKSEAVDNSYHFRNIFEASLLAKRMGDFEAALSYWQMLTEAYNPSFYQALEELAKFHEHRTRDLKQAEAVCKRANEVIYQMSQIATADSYQVWTERFAKRLARIRRKAAKLQ
jgi:hypothetical protein